jgi:ankyrin repeat protein
LSLAASNGHDGTVVLLLNNNPPPDTEASDTKSGKTALLWAAEKCHAQTVQKLLEKGADVEAVARVSRRFDPCSSVSSESCPPNSPVPRA